MSVYKQGESPNYYYDFVLDGKRHRGSCKTTSIVAARAFEAEECRRISKGEVNPGKVPTLEQLSSRFLAWVGASQRLSASSKRYYVYGWKALASQPIAGMKLNRITPSEIDCLKVDGEPATENQARRTLRRMLHLAEEWGLLTRAPRVPMVEEVATRDVIAPEVEQQITAALASSDSALRVAWVIAVDAGMRPKEIAGLRVDDIDWLAQAVTVRRRTTKTHNGVRVVPLSDRVVSVLQAYLMGRKDGYVFPSSRLPGQPIQAISLCEAFRHIRQSLGLPASVKLYNARHTFATEMMSALGNPTKVMALMGHGDIKTTMAYQHPDQIGIREAVEARAEARAKAIAAQNQTVTPDFSPELSTRTPERMVN